MSKRLFIKPEIPLGFGLFAGLVILLTFVLNLINNRFGLADFRVYYTAAQQLASGGEVYLVSFNEGSGFYKYSPFILNFFLPYTLLSFKFASVIHFFILGGAWIYTFILTFSLLRKHIFSGSIQHENLLLILSFIAVLVHFTREMSLGNINILMLLLCCLAIKNFLKGRAYTGGLFLGLAILTKPFYVLLLIPLLIRGQWRSLAGVILVVVAGLFLPFLYLGLGRAYSLNYSWIKTILNHNNEYPGMNSIDYLLRYYLFPSMSQVLSYLSVVILICFVVIFIYTNIHREENQAEGSRYPSDTVLFEWFLLLSILPSLLKTDWVQFLSSAPLIMFIIFHIHLQKKYLLILPMVFLLLFFSANSEDLLGRPLSIKLLEMGVMGLTNLFLIGFAMLLFIQEKTSKKIK